jgi:hypothetical protein
MTAAQPQLNYDEPYILHDASGVHMRAEALMPGLKIREEKFEFAPTQRFTYERTAGREGSSSTSAGTGSLQKTLSGAGSFVVKKSEVVLKWDRGTPKELTDTYTVLVMRGGALVSKTNHTLAFV